MLSYQDVFKKLHRPALIPFFVLGDPDEARSLELIKTAIDAGADILELGIPFSDPIADGPTIQKADIRALENGMTCSRAFELIRQVKAYRDIPIGLLMYYNLIERGGVEAFYRDAAGAGVNSVLVADLCIDDADEVTGWVQKNGMDTVFMVTPNTEPARRQQIAQCCTGFVYTVSVMGVTGARDSVSVAVKPLIQSLKRETSAPICVGFGVSKPEHAQALAADGADGVIVGSAVVKIIENNLTDHAQACRDLHAFIAAMRAALA